MHNRLLQ